MIEELGGSQISSRIASVLDLILALSGGDLAARAVVGDSGDDFDAVIGGLNMLAEELQISFLDASRRTAELEQANAELQAAQAQLAQTTKLASLGEIAAGIAHELNQPLGIIHLYCEAALERLASLPADDALPISEQIAVALDQVRRASEIIENVRTFSRDDPRAELVEADVTEIVAGGIVLLRRELTVANVELHEKVEPGLTLRCRPHHIQQVVFNLVANARDAVEDRARSVIELAVYTSNGSVVFDVCDNGAGIRADDQVHIMEPFFTTKPAGRGTGLGLPICQTIATSHGGSLGHERRDGWTVFSLRIPVVSD